MKEYVLDTSALFCYLDNEEGSDTVEQLLQSTVARECRIYISVISYINVFYVSWQQQGKEKAEHRIELLDKLFVERLTLHFALIRSVGEIKATKRMSFADCCIAGTAKLKNATLVHKDPEFEALENEIQQLKLPYKTKSAKA